MVDDATYRSKLDPSLELLSYTLQDLGVNVDGVPDAELVDIATRKLRMLYETATAIAGINPELIKIAMRG